MRPSRCYKLRVKDFGALFYVVVSAAKKSHGNDQPHQYQLCLHCGIVKPGQAGTYHCAVYNQFLRRNRVLFGGQRSSATPGAKSALSSPMQDVVPGPLGNVFFAHQLHAYRHFFGNQAHDHHIWRVSFPAATWKPPACDLLATFFTLLSKTSPAWFFRPAKEASIK